MSTRFMERPNYTHEQVVEHLRAAREAVREAEIPDELRAIAFEKACDWSSAKQIIMEQIQPLPGGLAIPRNNQ